MTCRRIRGVTHPLLKKLASDGHRLLVVGVPVQDLHAPIPEIGIAEGCHRLRSRSYLHDLGTPLDPGGQLDVVRDTTHPCAETVLRERATVLGEKERLRRSSRIVRTFLLDV